MLVTGELLLPGDAPTAAGATALIEIREIGQADAPSSVAGQQVLDDIAIGPGTRISFEVTVATVDPRHHYAVRAHVDLDGDGKVGPGDLLSMTSEPVLTFGAPDRVQVPLALILR